MKRSCSMPKLSQKGSSSLKTSVSTNALSALNANAVVFTSDIAPLDVIVAANISIDQAVSCTLEQFPSYILEQEPPSAKDFISCMLRPTNPEKTSILRDDINYIEDDRKKKKEKQGEQVCK